MRTISVGDFWRSLTVFADNFILTFTMGHFPPIKYNLFLNFILFFKIVFLLTEKYYGVCYLL